MEQAGAGGMDGAGGQTGVLIAAEAAQRRARGYVALPGAFVAGWPRTALRLWQWRDAGAMQAAALVLVHGQAATWHMAWASDAGRRAGAPRLLLWQAALALRAEGVQTLDLGPVDTEAAMGLARFKLGTGAALVPLGPTCLVLPG